MIFKIIVAVLVAYAGWYLWQGPKKTHRRIRPETLNVEAAAARAVLGVHAEASEAEIRAAHRRLISAVHPDHGGSAELTRRVNAARDTLLKRPS
ncbi:J domain-containing protein [Sphingomonas alpina]|uniref:DnaJ domain-containing protein n=1 Tax=Sphingomonas alpina TaxID=653931 RepID=A0A7H0LI53_9SPHN|nr:DnaJ domain-containing protein [Sphingomonas alpina]QNQ09356.1 DnaJ domain-containing protein [Sphingomonas alpina]